MLLRISAMVAGGSYMVSGVNGDHGLQQILTNMEEKSREE